jgi:hypothetical protein
MLILKSFFKIKKEEKAMANIITLLPEIEAKKWCSYKTIKDWDDQRAQQFATVYRARRKDPQLSY